MGATPGAHDAGPLAGHRVLDLARVWSGGMIGALLSGLGAEIIKVESGDNLDVVRLVGRPLVGGQRAKGPVTELNPMYHHINRDKRGICLNLKSPRGRELLLALAQQCDIVLENFSAGVMERLGLGYETLRGVRPDVIYAAVSSAGQDGPLARMKGYAPIISSLAGLEHMVGYEGAAPLGMMNFGLCDPNAGAQATFAVLAAVYHRERTGEGQYIDMSQLEACMVLLGEAMADLSFNGRTRNPGGNAHPTCCPHGIYACRGEDAWVAVSMPNDTHWAALCALLGRADWAAMPELAAAPGRLRRREEIDAALGAWCAGRALAEAADALAPLGLGAQPVLPVEETHARHPHFAAHHLLQTVELPYLGPYPLYAFPWPMSAWAPAIGRAAPQLGEHTTDVLRELLDLTDDELVRLRADKVINEA